MEFSTVLILEIGTRQAIARFPLTNEILAPRSRRKRMCGTWTLAYGTGIIAPAVMADASAREYAAQIGSNK
jgi:hypothetical protein